MHSSAASIRVRAAVALALALALALCVAGVRATSELALEADDATIFFGVASDTTLGRAGLNALHTPGSLSVGDALQVTGVSTLADVSAGMLSVAGISTLAGVSAGTLTVSGASTLSGGATVSGGSGLTVNGASGVTVNGPATATGKGTFGALQSTGTLAVTGSSTLAGLTATSLGVTGVSTLAGATATSLGVTGGVSAGTLTVSGASTLQGGATVNGAGLTVNAALYAIGGQYMSWVMLRLNTGVAQTVNPGAAVAVQFDTVAKDLGGFIPNPAFTQFKATAVGVYQVCAAIWWTTAPPAGSDTQIQLFSSFHAQPQYVQTAAGRHVSTCGSLIINHSGDYVEVRAFIGSGAANSIANERRALSIHMLSRY